MSRHLDVFRRLVRVLLPEEFRAGYGREMERTFAAQHREAADRGPGATARLWWETLVGLLHTAPREQIGQLRQDVAYGARMLRRTPATTAIALLTLAAGIGATTSVFSVVHAVLLRPLPYADPDRLALLWNHWPGSDRSGLSRPEVLDFRERLRSVELAAFANASVNLVAPGEPERLRASAISPNLLNVLGVQAALGRTFHPSEEIAGQDQVAIISDALWRRRFNGDAGVVGRSLVLDGQSVEVIGVLPPGFVMPHEYGDNERSDALVPLTMDPSAPRVERGTHFIMSAARLRSGSSMEQAQAEVDTITRAFQRENPGEYDPAYGSTLRPIRTEVVGEVRLALLVLAGAVTMVLLIGCANVANLLLARGQVRMREMSVRKAIGASQGRLVRQMITESLLLSALATTAGLAIAYWLTAVMARSAPNIPRMDEVRIDPTVLAFAAGVSVVTALVFGSLPATQLARADIGGHLRTERGGRSHVRLAVRSMLVTAQVALAMVLLAGAVLLLQSFTRLAGMPSGIRPDHVLTYQISAPLETYPERERVVAFYQQLLERARALPGVTAAGTVGSLPLQEPIGDWDFYVPGETPGPHGSDRAADWQVVTPGYFEAMGIRLLDGRFPADTDRATSPAVVVVNQTLARTYFDGHAVGKQIRMSGADQAWMTIVGVCDDVRHEGLDRPANAQLYIPHAQLRPFWRDSTLRSFAIAVRTSGEPLALASSLRAQAHDLDPRLPISNLTTMTGVLERSLAPRRFNMLLLTVFAAIALVLASVGTYGVVAYQVSERTREIGVRMALGARAADVTRMVVGQGMGPALLGIAVGLGGTLVLAGVIQALLFETTATDAATLGVTAVALLGAAFLACVLPARRATRIDPCSALRAE